MCLDHSIIICKLIYLHPWFIQLWIKLANTLLAQISVVIATNEATNDVYDDEPNKSQLISYLTSCYCVIKEIHKHGYAHRSELVSKQKAMHSKWVLFVCHCYFCPY